MFKVPAVPCFPPFLDLPPSNSINGASHPRNQQASLQSNTKRTFLSVRGRATQRPTQRPTQRATQRRPRGSKRTSGAPLRRGLSEAAFKAKLIKKLAQAHGPRGSFRASRSPLGRPLDRPLGRPLGPLRGGSVRALRGSGLQHACMGDHGFPPLKSNPSLGSSQPHWGFDLGRIRSRHDGTYRATFARRYAST